MSKPDTPMDHYSLNCETLSTEPNAAVIAIGVVQFDPNTARQGKKMYWSIDIASAMKSGRVDADTLLWWMKQDPRTQKVFFEDKKVPLVQALDELATFMRSNSMAPILWVNKVQADVFWLINAYKNGTVGLQPPWHHRNVRDMPTLVDAAGMTGTEWPFPQGVKHNALDDAIYQAHIISMAWMKCRGISPVVAPLVIPGATEKRSVGKAVLPVEKIDPVKEKEAAKILAASGIQPDPYLEGIANRNKPPIPGDFEEF